MSYLDELNEVQYNAVTHMRGPALVIAGPGSGKTRVLTYRIAHLVKQGVPPWQILALTFTNKAAKEMKARITKVVGERANRIWAGTFHSIFARILRSEAEHIGFPSNFTIYDTQDAKSLLKDIIKSQGLDPKTYHPGAVLGRISLAKNNLISPNQYKLDRDRMLEDKQAKKPYIYKIYDIYVQRCQRAGAMDFDDLLYRLHELLETVPEVADKYRDKFKFVLVDEFQDTNQLQSSIVRKLVRYAGSEENICVVGDDAQSIYAFRGATIQNILDFEKDFPNLSVYKLEKNYRSTSHIVEAANTVISHNSRQLKKTIVSQRGEGERIRIMQAATDNEEAKRVAEMIVELRTRNHLRHEDIAILYRTNAQSRVFEEKFKNFRIPYRIFGGLSFYDRKEVKDTLAYLRVLVNPLDDEALRRIINYPRRGIGKTTLDALTAAAAQHEQPLWNIIKQAHQFKIGARPVKLLGEFVYLIEYLQRRNKDVDAHDIAQYVVKHVGILKDLKKDKSIEGQSRVENVNELLDGIKSFVENDEVFSEEEEFVEKDLTGYLQNVALYTDMDEDGDENDKVKLMSVHAAKGLEFKAVFVVGLEENIFPSFMALNASDKRAALDEERRLFYVAITRAEAHLMLTYASSRYRHGKMQYNSSSRFLEEIASNNLDKTEDFMASKVTGPRSASGFSRLKKASELQPPKWTGNFERAPLEQLVENTRVEHLNFGLGLIQAIDGEGENKIATIEFEDETVGRKRIMLKYAKLRIRRPRKNKRYTEE